MNLFSPKKLIMDVFLVVVPATMPGWVGAAQQAPSALQGNVHMPKASISVKAEINEILR
jgi:hypothetical protein